MKADTCADAYQREDMATYFCEEGDSVLSCILLANHEGACLLQKPDGKFICWEDDICSCTDCWSDDPEMWHVTIWDVTDDEAQKIINKEGLAIHDED